MLVRIVLRSILALVLLLSTAVTALAGGKPEREPANLDTVVFEGICEFDVVAEHPIDRSIVTTFPETKDGSQRIMSTGFVRAEVTNAETGDSVIIDVTGQLTIWFRADGSIFAAGHGPLVAYYTAADADLSPLGQGLFYIQGRITETYNSDGELIDASFTGHAVDLCAQLSG